MALGPSSWRLCGGVAAGIFFVAASITYAFLSADDAADLDNLVDEVKHQSPQTLADAKSPLVHNVIVAGAWRHPDQSLCLPFKVRLEDGLRYALLLGAPNLILTGGKNDSVVAREYLMAMRVADVFGLNDSDEGTSSPAAAAAAAAADAFVASVHESLLPRLRSVRAALLHPSPSATVGDVIHRLPLRIFAENRSRTTFENAIFTAELLARLETLGAAEAEAIDGNVTAEESLLRANELSSAVSVVVSSRYHMRRCRAFFRRHLPTHHVIALPAMSQSEFELILPKTWIIWNVIDPEKPPLPKSLPQRAVLSVASIFPSWFLTFSFTVLRTLGTWQAYLRCVVLSTEPASALRELGAIFVNVRRGHLRFGDLLA